MEISLHNYIVFICLLAVPSFPGKRKAPNTKPMLVLLMGHKSVAVFRSTESNTMQFPRIFWLAVGCAVFPGLYKLRNYRALRDSTLAVRDCLFIPLSTAISDNITQQLIYLHEFFLSITMFR